MNLVVDNQLLGDRSFGFLLLLALGLIEKDGLFITAGLAMTIISVFALGGLVWAIVTSALLFLQHLAGQ